MNKSQYEDGKGEKKEAHYLNSLPILILDQGSISTTFYAQLFRTYVLRTAFLYLHFRFVLHLHKTIGAKAARRLMMKLTPVGWATPLASMTTVETS